MEPMSATSAFLISVIAGVLGNRSDDLLYKSQNVVKRMFNNVQEPTNQEIQCAVRRAYLKATLLTCKSLKKNKYSSHIITPKYLSDISSYFHQQIKKLDKDKTFVPPSDFDSNFETLLQSKGVSTKDRLPELILTLKQSILHSLEVPPFEVKEELKKYILEGWEENGKHVDWYELMCAFFQEELKNNPHLSTIIQTNLLIKLNQDISGLQLSFDAFVKPLQDFFEEYKKILPILDEINEKVDRNFAAIQNIETKIDNAKVTEVIYTSAEYQQFQKSISRLQRLMELTDDMSEKLEYSKELNELQSQLEAFKRDIIQLAETFQKIDIDTDRLRLAKQHFDNGEYKEARAVLDAEQMTGELDALLVEKERLNEKTVRNTENLYDKAEEFLILAKLTAINYNLPNRFEKAKEYFEKSLQADKNPINLTYFSMFLHEHNKLDYAAKNYEDLLTLIEDLKEIHLSYLNDKGLTLNNLGMIYRKLGKFDKSIKCYEEAIEIGKKGESSNNKLLLSVLSLALSNFGVLQDDLGNYENAIILYKDSFKLKVKFQPESKHSQTQILMNLGIVYSKKNQINESEEYYQKAKSIAENLIIQNETDENLSLLGDILLNYAQLKLKNKDFDSADKYNSLCLSIFEQLAASNPYVHIERVASAKSNLAVIKRNTNKLVEAKQLYLDAYDIYAKLSIEFPESYSPRLATVSNNIALFYQDLEEFDVAMEFHQKALNVRRKLFSQNAEVHAADLSQSLLNISVHYEMIKNREKAIDFMLEAVQILVPLSEKIPFTREYLSKALWVLNKWDITPPMIANKP